MTDGEAQLCLALDGRRQAGECLCEVWLSPDIARRTYMEATTEKLHLLNLLKRHEEARGEEEKLLRDHLEQRLRVSCDSLLLLMQGNGGDWGQR